VKRIALIGAGQRGNIYARQVQQSGSAKIVAVVEPNDQRRALAAEEYQLEPEQVFENTTEFYKSGKLADAVILASMDRDHYLDAMSALELGYDMLLEKPISPSPKECIDIQKKADDKGCKVIVCHVLRYTAFFSTIKKIIDSGELGKIITIQHNENIGNFHMAHSFVRGNWSRTEESSPLIMQKSCHDMDILTWLVDSEARTISSFGNLSYFNVESAPKGSADRCLECGVSEECRFDARKVYLPILGNWPATVIGPDQTEHGILEALKTSPYGRCVYRCDNDVCDNQVTLIEFKNGVTVSFNLSAFTNRVCRTLKIMCENGEIRGDDDLNQIEVIKFASNQVDKYDKKVIIPERVDGGHGGGDTGLMIDFLNQLENKTSGNDSRSSIQKSIESHIMSHAAEVSRLTGKTISVDQLKTK
jgi:hypothetical protein